MDTLKLIEALGGRKAVIEMTGLTRGRISHWVTQNHIPRPWLKFFQEKFPDLDWPNLIDNPEFDRRKGERRKGLTDRRQGERRDH